jgi:hypothetical protein
MTSTTLESGYARPSWAPGTFKATAVLTFASGFVLHVTRLIIGVDDLVRYVVTPPVDIAFGLVMAIAAVAGVLSWRRYSGTRAGRIVFGFMVLILIASIPLHLKTAINWSTDYLRMFPSWYSAAEVPMFLALAWIAARLKFD